MENTSFVVQRDELKVIMERVFDAPRQLVWDVVNNPEYYPRWWGPAGLETVVEAMDVRVGGAWRIVQTDSDGNRHPFYGEYIEVVPPGKVIWTFNYEPIGPGHENRQTLTLVELDGEKTLIRAVTVFKNAEDLEGMVGAGMESGAVEGWERLAVLIDELK